MMDDGEVESPSSGGGLFDLHSDPYSQFLDDSIIIQNEWDTLIGTQICSHTHICNPATGPDNTHTHTCEHTHTQTISSGDEEKLTKKRRPSGNKEAVRKYREKQKAVKVNLEVRNAELEKENLIIPELQKENIRLRKKLQEQSPRQDAFQHLLAENKRLKALLSQVRRSIDSELEGLNYSRALLTQSAKVDRVYHPSGAGCAAPVPCFPARPVHNNGGLIDDITEEGSLGWHTECQLVGNTAVCQSPRGLEEAHVGSEQCASSVAKLTTRSKKMVSPIVRSSKSAGVARNLEKSPLPSITTGTVASSYHHPVVVPCSANAPPVPCFDKATRQVASIQARQPQQHNCVESWQEGCDLSCGDIDMAPDSSPQSGSLSPPNKVLQSPGTLVLKPTLVTSATKKSLAEEPSSADMFVPGCLYSNNGPSMADSCWNQQSLTVNGWLEQCDFIDGVCHAHIMNAAQDSCFRPSDETAEQCSRLSAAAISPRVCN